MTPAVLLEREDALARLDTALARARAASGSVMMIRGEAGIGKTSLVNRFQQMHRADARILRGYCDPLLTPTVLGPLHDIARDVGRGLQALLEDGSRTLAIYGRLLEILRATAQPVVLVFEDIHWADDVTLDLVKYLARRIDADRVLLIATFREDEVSRRPPLRRLLGDLATTSAVDSMELSRLSPAAVEGLAYGRITDAKRLYRETGGNPFYVTEVIANPSGGVPASVREAVLSRADQLSPEGREVLDFAAIIGARVEVGLLGSPTLPRSRGLSECLEAGLLVGADDGLIFRHELARNAILEAIDPLRRRSLHRQVLEVALGAGFDRQGRFARLAHYAEAAGDASHVVTFAGKAAEVAAAAGAHREAAAHFRAVLRFAEGMSDDDRARHHFALARETTLIGQLDEAIGAYRRAIALWEELGKTLRAGEALAAMAWALVRNGDNSAAEGACAQALAILEPLGQTLELASAYQMRAYLAMLDRDRDCAIQFGEMAVKRAVELGAAEIHAAAEMVVGTALLVSDDSAGNVRLDRSETIARENGYDEIVALVHVNRGSSLGEQYHFAEAEAELLKGLAFTRERDLDISSHYLASWLALTYMFLGRWRDAEDVARKLLEQENLSAVSRIMALVALGRVQARRGDIEARATLDDALVLAERTATLQRLAPVRAARAELASFVGDLAGVAREADAALPFAERRRHAWHYGEFLFWRAECGLPVAVPSWTAEPYALQLTGRWREAADAWRSRGCPYEEARALAQGDHPARLRALRILDALGAQPAAAALRRRMREDGEDHVPRGARASTRQNQFRLTTKEMTVLARLVLGASNREIATTLFISPKTVDHHVSAILSKLAAKSRQDAAEIALRLRLVVQNGELSSEK